MIKFAPERAVVLKRRHLSRDYYSLTFGPCSRAGKCRPGQFVHIMLPDTSVYFRRAMSLAAVDVASRQVEIIFKVFGRGTTIMAEYTKDTEIDILGPLGTPFKLPRKTDRVLLVGGGVGFPPLLYLASHLVATGFDPKQIEFFYGGRTSGEIVERQRIRALGVNFHPVTDDGSYGDKGLVTTAVESWLDTECPARPRLYSCGPEAMLKAVDELGMRRSVPGQLSLEAPMPCGFGVCLGCVVPLRAGGHARVCTEGPVFEIGEVLL